ncbi:MAG: ABC transporter permease [Chloroflexi bacterium]|nr:ABC transporter permease [Chloroflexota bacterium]
MTTYIMSRLGQAAITILGISLVVFALARLSGDASALLIPPDATADQKADTRTRLGLDKPLPVQYGIFLKGIATGDFGKSFRFGEPSLKVFWQRFPNTLQLAAVAAFIALSGGILIGVLSAVKAGGLADRISSLIALLGQAVPSFLIGILMIVFFSVELGWLPTSGKAGPKTYIMPGIALAWYSMAALTRMTKSSMLDVMDTDYIRLARLKGLPERTVIWKHAFRNALVPILTLFSLQLIFFISGSVIIENIFAWPGIGQLTVQAIFSRDYPLVQTIVFVTSSILVLLNVAVDLLYAFIDPRIRLS